MEIKYKFGVLPLFKPIASMLVFNKIASLQNHLRSLPNFPTIGFVPTMGALHEGHLQLVREARQNCDIVVASIFVNPLQFNNSQDFAKYPITLEKDEALLKSVGCHILFAPNAQEMYPTQPQLKFDFGPLETVMEGKFRPGHFNGVGIVVSKLFHIVAPHTVYFGQKDFQQCAVIQALIKDLSFPITMVTVPTVREKSGLAMSSRNQRLSPEGLTKAASIYQGLQAGETILLKTRDLEAAQKAILQVVASAGIEVEYVEIADPDTLIAPTPTSSKLVICFAGFLEGVRLIDNILIDYIHA